MKSDTVFKSKCSSRNREKGKAQAGKGSLRKAENKGTGLEEESDELCSREQMQAISHPLYYEHLEVLWAEHPAGLGVLRAIRKQSAASHLWKKQSVLFMLLFTRKGQDS